MIIKTSCENQLMGIVSQSAGNLTGSSETIRKLSEQDIDWLAGVLDGDGNFDIRNISSVTGVKKRTLKQIRITMHPRDSRVLHNVKGLLGGSIKVKGKKYLLWTIGTKEAMSNCINLINGRIRLKVPGFKESCELYGIEFIKAPNIIEKNSAYLAGLVDTDGSIAFNYQKNSIVLTLEFQDNEYSSVLDFSEVIPGITPDRISLVKRNKTADKNFYSIRYTYQKVFNMMPVYEYFKLNRLYSDFKFYRAMKIKRFVELRKLKTFNKDSVEYKLYMNFLKDYVTHLNEHKPLPLYLKNYSDNDIVQI